MLSLLLLENWGAVIVGGLAQTPRTRTDGHGLLLHGEKTSVQAPEFP